METQIYGIIGYSVLYESILFPNCSILLLNDNHEEMYDKCLSDAQINIDEFLIELMNKNYKILIEEVPNSAELYEIFPTSTHVKRIRKLCLDNKDKIFSFDIRLDLINITEINITNNKDKLYMLFNNIYDVFLLKNSIFKKFSLYNKDIDNSLLKEYYINIMIEFKNLIYEYSKFMSLFPKDIPSFELYKLVNKTDKILSNIMEFYVILKLYDILKDYNYTKDSKIVIYCGLLHSVNLKTIIMKYFKFNFKNKDGITYMHEINHTNINNICISKFDF